MQSNLPGVICEQGKNVSLACPLVLGFSHRVFCSISDSDGSPAQPCFGDLELGRASQLFASRGAQSWGAIAV